jgi:hypothetical protein
MECTAPSLERKKQNDILFVDEMEYGQLTLTGKEIYINGIDKGILKKKKKPAETLFLWLSLMKNIL